jgi:hypothetical protein
MLADCRDMADDFMPRYARIKRSCPFGADLIQVGMADASIGDGDLDVMRPYRPAFDVDGFDWFVGGVGAIGFDGHLLSLFSDLRLLLSRCVEVGESRAG